MLKRLIAFLVINFAGLGIGSLFTKAITESWYSGLSKAPWTPEGWVFGAAWTLIMLCFSLYLALGISYYQNSERKVFLLTFGGSWLLNVLWNVVFFEFHLVEVGLFILFLLTLFVFRFLQLAVRHMKWEWILILPYLVWMLVAFSLNLYVLIYN